jgi:septal ring factor EnvC (AmiA/AmiB activator)
VSEFDFKEMILMVVGPKVNNNVNTMRKQSIDQRIQVLEKEIRQIKSDSEVPQETKDKRVKNMEKQIASLREQARRIEDNLKKSDNDSDQVNNLGQDNEGKKLKSIKEMFENARISGSGPKKEDDSKDKRKVDDSNIAEEFKRYFFKRAREGRYVDAYV